MSTPVEGTKFPLYLTDEEWLLLVNETVLDYAYTSDKDMVTLTGILENLKAQLEKLGMDTHKQSPEERAKNSALWHGNFCQVCGTTIGAGEQVCDYDLNKSRRPKP